jgi:uncharacterized damage-inducible protein DinB
MSALDGLLLALDRQQAMILDLLDVVSDDHMSLRALEGRMTLGEHFQHISEVRMYWLGQIAAKNPGANINGPRLPFDGTRDGLRQALEGSHAAARSYLAASLESDSAGAPYDHPALYFGHMLWHEGWHVGQIDLALERGGAELSEEWAERALWERWRGPEEWE